MCRRQVVAPPIITGMVSPACLSCDTTLTISSRLGVMSPLSPIISGCSCFAFSTISSAGVMTPRSIIS